jgi:hypothetical protein
MSDGINLGNTRLSDYALSGTTTTSYFIEKQFPAIYRENGRELIELVKSYYEFLETDTKQSTYNIRRIYDYRDIDKTLERMIVFFKNKYMNGLYLEQDTPFIVKNILDLYRRKGSKEGIELFFKMFFDTEVEIYYPSFDIFKPSASQWKIGTFIQLYDVVDITVFGDIVNRKIYGDKSLAEAFVDSVYFVNVNEATVPILFLSEVKGQFTGFDVIFSLSPNVTYGRVYGSANRIEIDRSAYASGENKIGDIVRIDSPIGIGAKARVTNVSEEISGEIDFRIVNGGFGYTLNDTDIRLSDHTVFFADPGSNIGFIEFNIGERIRQINSHGAEVIGTILGQDNSSFGVELDVTQPDAITSPETYILEVGFEIETLDRTTNIVVAPLFVTQFNDSASADIGTITNTETVQIITDLISNFLSVSVNSSNYSTMPPALAQMTGTIANAVQPNLSTPLNEAFVPIEFTIGSIDTLSNINPGVDYLGNAFISARENTISRFDLRDQIIRIEPASGVIIFVGDNLIQQKTVQTFEGDMISVTVKGRVVRVDGNDIYVSQMSFESFSIDQPLFKLGNNIPVSILAISRDIKSQPIGLNARIDGIVENISGKIRELQLTDSGIGYSDGSDVSVINLTKIERTGDVPSIPDVLGTIFARGQGFTEGRWTSFTSNINREKVIQDSFYYQDYSYEINTDISPDLYESEYKELLHPTGIKLFTKFSKSDIINSDIEIFHRISTVDSNIGAIFESDTSSTIGPGGFPYLTNS